MLRKLKLYGELAKFVGHKEFEIKADTLSKAVSFLINNFDGIEKFMSPKYYQVKVGNYEIGEEEVHYPIGQEDIHFIPVITGAGRGLGKVLLGAALIGATFLTGGAFISRAPFQALTFTSGLAKGAFYLGAALTLQGVSDMLFPLPEQKEFTNEEDPRISFNFSGDISVFKALCCPWVISETF